MYDNRTILHCIEPSLTDLREVIKRHMNKRAVANTNVPNDSGIHPELIPSRQTFINEYCHHKLNEEIISEM